MAVKRGKRWRADIEKVAREPQPMEQAVQTVQGFSQTKFVQTVEMVCKLGIDPRQADQMVRGSVALPHGIGATRRVIAFCEGDDVDKAKQAGAVEAGGEELVKRVQDGWLDFDVAISTPAMMRLVGRLGRVLGPQGKMPSPKSGTVTPDVTTAVREYSAGKIEFRNDSGGNIHVPIGKMNFEASHLVDNANAMLDQLRRMRPQSAKGTYFQKVVLSGTMTPGVPVEIR